LTNDGGWLITRISNSATNRDVSTIRSAVFFAALTLRSSPSLVQVLGTVARHNRSYISSGCPIVVEVFDTSIGTAVAMSGVIFCLLAWYLGVEGRALTQDKS
jgi:hypothetical protein